jgi:hypothetical protein
MSGVSSSHALDSSALNGELARAEAHLLTLTLVLLHAVCMLMLQLPITQQTLSVD